MAFLRVTAVAVLRRHRSIQQAELAALGERYEVHVFTSLNGAPHGPYRRLSRHFRRLSTAAGLQLRIRGWQVPAYPLPP